MYQIGYGVGVLMASVCFFLTGNISYGTISLSISAFIIAKGVDTINTQSLLEDIRTSLDKLNQTEE